ncbi:MAG: UDP-N-acetylglucosamine 1-carboxyvinyltransferase [Phycisphaerales bacterium]
MKHTSPTVRSSAAVVPSSAGTVEQKPIQTNTNKLMLSETEPESVHTSEAVLTAPAKVSQSTGKPLGMEAFRVTGGRQLKGTVRASGSKNASLPLIAAALLTDQPLILHDVPDLSDIRNMLNLMGELGCSIDTQAHEDGSSRLTLHADPEGSSHAPYEIVKTMRASICVLGPLVARRGFARVSMPGGCSIGDRPVDIHLRGLRALGAEIELDQGDITARAPKGGLRGATIFLGGPFGSTVLGTANVMCAAALANGKTIIESAACEPEIVDLANMLRAMGAHISGDGSPRITIEGVPSLGGTTHTVMPDRIEAGTWICAGALMGEDLTITNCPMDSLLALTSVLEPSDVSIEVLDPASPQRTSVRVRRNGVIKPAVVTTQPHPGFPTDIQAQVMALLSLADGNSIITERIFPDRFLHVAELSRMGATIHRQGPIAVVTGVRELHGAPVMASDLRASASLVLAGLAAKGTTTISRVYHLDRGYERMDERLQTLGADIERFREVRK